MSDELNAKQKLFCKEYLIDLNATKAYKRAKYDVKSDDVAKACASRLLSDANIVKYIKQLQSDAAAVAELSPEWVLKRLMQLANVKAEDLFNKDGEIKPIHEIDEGAQRSIQSIQIDEIYEGFGADRVKIGEAKKIKTTDRLKALDLLGKYLNIFSDKIHLEAGKSLEEIITNSFKK